RHVEAQRPQGVVFGDGERLAVAPAEVEELERRLPVVAHPPVGEIVDIVEAVEPPVDRRHLGTPTEARYRRDEPGPLPRNAADAPPAGRRAGSSLVELTGVASRHLPEPGIGECAPEGHLL